MQWQPKSRIARCALTLLAALGCSSHPDADAVVDAGIDCALELTWGHRDDTLFVPFENGDSAEITLGFQGFRFIQSVLRYRGPSADEGKYGARVAVVGFDPYVLPDARVRLASEADGALYAEGVLVFFNDLPIADIIGKTADITLTGSAAGCHGTTQASIVLHDDDTCTQQSDGGLACSDADGGS
jgi:hypothetical protein